MSTVVAFCSSEPAVLDAYADWQSEMHEHLERIRALQKVYDPDCELTVRGWGTRFGYLEGDTGATVPEGWRRSPSGHILPDKRLKLGKQAATAIEALNGEAPSSFTSRPIGMPSRAFVGNHLYEPGAFQHDGAVFVHWGGMPEDVDAQLWTEILLSQFYAAQEAYEAAEAGSR
jgi:hypothetical protein